MNRPETIYEDVDQFIEEVSQGMPGPIRIGYDIWITDWELTVFGKEPEAEYDFRGTMIDYKGIKAIIDRIKGSTYMARTNTGMIIDTGLTVDDMLRAFESVQKPDHMQLNLKLKYTHTHPSQLELITESLPR